MLLNYLRTAVRTLRAHRTFSLINITGLAASLAVCLLILAFAWEQARYDAFHAKGDRIVRVLTEQLNAQGGVETTFAASPAPLANAVAEEVPGVVATARIGQIRALALRDGNGVPVEGLFAEPSFFDLFDFEIGSGGPAAILGRPGQVILTPETARTLFGTQDAVGQTLTLEGMGTYTVGGITAPPPGKTHLQFDLLVSFVSQQSTDRREELVSWENRWSFATYVLLDAPSAAERLQRGLNVLANRHYGDQEAPAGFRVQALGEIALGPLLANEIASYSVPAVVVYFLAALAGIIMLAAGFNYVSLSVARSMRRAPEVGVRKALGADRVQVVAQLLGESVVTALLTLGLALCLLVGLVPAFNGLTFVQMGGVGIDPTHLLDPRLLGLFVLFTVGVGTLAGLYPALRLSRFEPASVLRGMADVRGFSGHRLRHTLTGLQFAVALFFVVTATLLLLQFRHLAEADYGFDQERLLTVGLQDQPFEVVGGELARLSGVRQVAATSKLPASGSTSRIAVRREGIEEPVAAFEYAASPGFVESLGLRMVAGRPFSASIASDSARAVVLNEQAASALGFSTPQQALGASLDLMEGARSARVIGVVEDYHYGLMVDPLGPMLLHYTPSELRYAVARVAPGAMETASARAEALWERLDPVHPAQIAQLDVQMRDNPINRILEDVGRVVGGIAVLAVLISCLGLLGMALYTAETRRKEVGVRKVLGASRWSLALLLSRDVLRVVATAGLMTLPLAWLASSLWLQAFASRIAVGPGLLAACVLGLVGIALLVVSTQTIRAARTDPSRILRAE